VTGLPAWVIGVLLVVVMPAAASMALVGIQRRWPRLAEREQNDVAGFVIAVVGVLYAVLLAFVVIVSWENYSQAEGIVGQEASALRSIYRESTAFPVDAREQLRDDVRLYASTAIEQEWPAMAAGQSGSQALAQVIDEMSVHLAQLPTATAIQQEYVGAEAALFKDLVTSRSKRLDYVGQGVPAVLWIALVVGAVVTIGFASLFGMRSKALHIVITSGLAALIGVLLFVAIVIDKPFAGDVHVEPNPLERVLTDFGPPS
jgi:uncharacterized membrane protein